MSISRSKRQVAEQAAAHDERKDSRVGFFATVLGRTTITLDVAGVIRAFGYAVALIIAASNGDDIASVIIDAVHQGQAQSTISEPS